MQSIGTLSESILLCEFAEAASMLHHDHVANSVELVLSIVTVGMCMAAVWIDRVHVGAEHQSSILCEDGRGIQ